MTNPTSEDRMLTIENRLAVCPNCDAGLPANCTCPGVDEYREDVTYLIEVIQAFVDRDLRRPA